MGALFALALVLPSFAVGSRRLHDIGKTGWLQLVLLIPLVGLVLMIYWMAQQGEPGANQYGPPPETAPAAPLVAPGQQ